MSFSLFVSCPRGLEYLLGDELKALGLNITKTTPMGVYGHVDNLALIYHICLWSRIANRVQLILFNGNVANDQSIYQLCHQFHWHTVFSPEKTFAIEFHGKSRQIRNTMYGAQLIKDAIVDYFSREGKRPSVDKKNHNILIHAYLKHDELTVSLDLCGYSLHQRGYRNKAGLAPIKENVAAALLMRANWHQAFAEGISLVDPFCGSATLLIEAALIASQTAPGLLRHDQAVTHWAGHKPSLWQKVRKLATEQIIAPNNQIIGFDVNPKAIKLAEQSIEAAGFSKYITIKQQAISDYQPISGRGIILSNPPYGERLDEATPLIPTYQDIGRALAAQVDWQAYILTSNQMLAKAIGLRSFKQYQFFNGQIEAKLYCFKMDKNNQLRFDSDKALSENCQMLINRLSKNLKNLSKWRNQSNISCYRLYDADIPEYACAVDIYDNWAHIQEYAAPKSIPEHKTEQRILDMMQALPRVLSIPPANLVLKQRRRQKGRNQYQTQDNKKHYVTVHEGHAKFYINLHDYLDTGLFLDHRLLRQKFFQTLHGKTLLNCFCYTGAFSVQAALGGAKTVNVDLSKTYLDWAEKNFKLNNLNTNQHQFIQADCLQWLNSHKKQFDVILLDPPSFSNSKRMKTTLDIQRDHTSLINRAMKLLAPAGTLYFSTNLRKFKISEQLKEKYQITDITHKTTDVDFKRSKNTHQCYEIKF